MAEHNAVERFTRLPSQEDEYVYEIQRKNVLPPVRVHISDAYSYGFADFASRPKAIGPGDFIVVSQFGPALAGSIVEHARAARIGIGTVGKLMGALNIRDVWKYVSPAEKAAAAQRGT